MIKTFEELNKIDQIYGKLLKEEGFAKTKLAYCFKRFSDKNLVKIFTEYNEELQDNRIDNALTDEKTKALLYMEDGKNFQYSREGLKAVLKQNKETTEKWNKKEIEIEPFICTDLGDIEFTAEEEELLKGVIIS